MSNASYSRKEINQILKNAIEIQTQKESNGEIEGLTEEELLGISNEIGVDAASLYKALQKFQALEKTTAFNWLTGTANIEHTALVKGTLKSPLWEEVVREAQLITNNVGTTSQLGNANDWEFRTQFEHKLLSVISEKGTTKIRLTSSWRAAKVLFTLLGFVASVPTVFFGASLISGLNSIYLTELQFMFALLGGVIAGLPFGRVFLKLYFNKQKKQLEEIASFIKQNVETVGNPNIYIEEDAYTNTADFSQNQNLRN